MAEISDLDWAQHIKMDYAQNLRKDTETAKIKTIRYRQIFLGGPRTKMKT